MSCSASLREQIFTFIFIPPSRVVLGIRDPSDGVLGAVSHRKSLLGECNHKTYVFPCLHEDYLGARVCDLLFGITGQKYFAVKICQSIEQWSKIDAVI